MKKTSIFGQSFKYFFVVAPLFGGVDMVSRADSINCVSPPSGLIAWWPGEGNANDIVGANNGALVGGVSFAPGEVGQAFVFDAADQVVRIPASLALNVGTGSGFTIEGWINPVDVSQPYPIVEWNNGTDSWGAHFWIDPNQPFQTEPGTECGPGELYANIVDDGGGWHQFSSGSGILTSNVFQHVALTYDQASGEAAIYCNGVIIAQATLGTFTPATSYDFCLGARLAPADDLHSFAGLMDEFSLYNRALSSNEIAAIYNAGSAGKCNAIPPLIWASPASRTVGVGSPAAFSVSATGTSPLCYQWWHNESEVAGATNSILTIGSAQFSDAGNYFVVVTNLFGSAISSDAALTVRVLPTLRIAQSNGQVTLAWPVWAHDFELQSSEDISLSPDGWAKIVAAPQLNGGNLTVILPGSETAQFYRLHLP